MRALTFGLAAMTIASIALEGQVYPGGYPPGGYPPGGYPPGAYPPGAYPPGAGGTVPGIPMPHRKKKDAKKDDAQADDSPKQSGTVSEKQDKTISVELTDKRVIEYQLQPDTKYLNAGGTAIESSGIAVGDQVEVAYSQDDKGAFSALRVKLVKTGHHDAPVTAMAGAGAGKDSAPPANAPAESEASPAPAPVTAANSDEEAPTLKRGIPKKRSDEDDLEKQIERDAAGNPIAPKSVAMAKASAAPMPTRLVTNGPPPAPNPNAPLIERARDVANEWVGKLPNFLCEQFTTRYMSDTRPADWHAQDVVSAKVIYEDGRERYENISINGRPSKVDPAKGGEGAWSQGEFGTMLADLFSPATAANFRASGDGQVSGLSSKIYDFAVDQPHSHWRIIPGGQYYDPAYRGSIWVDKKEARTLRIEEEALDLPKDFPVDHAEMTIDYDFVAIGTQRVLLPVKAEVLMCQRGTPNCNRNIIEFRNYHKYGAESTVKFGP